MRQFLLPFFAAALIFASLPSANAQVPRMFSYQGVVINPTTGQFITDGPHNILIKIYDGATAVTELYSENQTGILFVKGMFNVMVGSVTPIPNTVAFDRGYFIGVSVDIGTEMTPRTAISPAPYAIHALIADALASNASGVVTSVNNISGAVKIQAGTGTVVTNNGSTITVSSTGVGGTGIQGVQNSDNSIAIANPTGPLASISVGVAGITTTKIADLSVTAAKLDGSGQNAGMILTANGLGGVEWHAGPSGGLTLPFQSAASADGTNSVFQLTNSGTGRVGYFESSSSTGTGTVLTGSVSNASGSGNAVEGITLGTGKAGLFTISNAGNSSNTLGAITNGTGRAGYFEVTNASPTVPALEVKTASTASSTLGIYSSITGSTTGANNVAAAIKGEHDGTTGIGFGVWGKHAGTGTGVLGSVHGNGGYGVSGAAYGTTSTAMIASYLGSSNSGIAMELSNGYIKVSGASKTAYTHITSAANLDPNNANSTILSYPGMASSDMVIVTHVSQNVRLGNGYGVWYNNGNQAWEILLETNPAAAMPNGEKFNVLVIKQ